MAGFCSKNKRHKTGAAPKGILAVHILLALICYVMLGATVFMGIDTAALIGLEIPTL